MTIDHDRFARLLENCSQLAAQNALVRPAWEEHLAVPGQAWIDAHRKVQELERAHFKAEPAQIQELQNAYQTARKAALRYLPDLALPESLDPERPPTSLQYAHELMETARQFEREAWGYATLRGDFGTRTSRLLGKAWEAMAKDRALAQARSHRDQTHAEAKEGYQSFRKVVRAMLGSHSEAARRISPPGSPLTRPTPPMPHSGGKR